STATALCCRSPAGRAFRPRRKKKPATAASRIAAAEKTSPARFRKTWVVDPGEEICAGTTAAGEEEPLRLAEGSARADTSAPAGEPGGAGDGMAATAALLPDSVSRFNL